MSKNTLETICEYLFDFLPASFYAIVAGAFIGLATNLLTSLILAQGVHGKIFVELAILFIFISSGVFVGISIVVARIESETRGTNYFLQRVTDQAKVLVSLLVVGVITIICAMVLLTLR